jgi:hypothetical protein
LSAIGGHLANINTAVAKHSSKAKSGSDQRFRRVRTRPSLVESLKVVAGDNFFRGDIIKKSQRFRLNKLTRCSIGAKHRSKTERKRRNSFEE